MHWLYHMLQYGANPTLTHANVRTKCGRCGDPAIQSAGSPQREGGTAIA